MNFFVISIKWVDLLKYAIKSVTRDIELVDITAVIWILFEFHTEDNLPKDGRVLLKTPQNTEIF